jgi:hypothetical protein
MIRFFLNLDILIENIRGFFQDILSLDVKHIILL